MYSFSPAWTLQAAETIWSVFIWRGLGGPGIFPSFGLGLSVATLIYSIHIGESPSFAAAQSPAYSALVPLIMSPLLLLVRCYVSMGVITSISKQSSRHKFRIALGLASCVIVAGIALHAFLVIRLLVLDDKQFADICPSMKARYNITVTGQECIKALDQCRRDAIKSHVGVWICEIYHLYFLCLCVRRKGFQIYLIAQRFLLSEDALRQHRSFDLQDDRVTLRIRPHCLFENVFPDSHPDFTANL